MLFQSLKSVVLLSLCGMLVLLGGCSTIDDIISSNAKVDYKRGYDFDDIERVAVVCDMDAESCETPMSTGEIERMNIALRRALVRRNFVVVESPADADIVVSWHVVAQEQSNVREYNAEAYYQCWRCGPAISNTTVDTYTQGTFIVDMIDPALSKSVWRGVMQGRLARVSNVEVQQQRFDKAAREMFAKFPPGILIDGVY